MVGKWILLAGQCALLALCAACTITLVEPPAQAQPQALANGDLLYQTSTLSSLTAGDFDGELLVNELRLHGDFGLGTFDALDGEMVVLDGDIYQVREDGAPQLADDATQTPFAAVTYFEADQAFEIDEAGTCADLQAQIDAELANLDLPYAIKVSGDFAHVQMRAPRPQNPPYPTLAEALVDQALFEAENVSGTMVGFRLPEYLAVANVAGYHFHFLSDDRQQGGHLLDCQLVAATVEIDSTSRIYMDVATGTD
jgi:acetolactate decarboxylase